MFFFFFNNLNILCVMHAVSVCGLSNSDFWIK